MKPVISVIMPVYNRAETVGAAIESILSQSVGDFEFIILDDCSQDDTVGRIRNFQDSRIRLAANSQKGNIPMLRNQGLAMARGRYIAMMDSDDIAMPTRLETEMKFLEGHPDYGLVGTDVYQNTAPGEPYKLCQNPKGSGLLRYMTAFKCCFCNPTVMVRRSALDEHHIVHREGYTVASDYALQVDLLPFAKFENLADVGLKYHFHKGNITNNTMKDSSGLAARWKILDEIHARAVRNLGITLDEAEMGLFVAFTGESNKPLPPYERFEEFKRLLERMKEAYGSSFGEDVMEEVHQGMYARIERNYARQEGNPCSRGSHFL